MNSSEHYKFPSYWRQGYRVGVPNDTDLDLGTGCLTASCIYLDSDEAGQQGVMVPDIDFGIAIKGEDSEGSSRTVTLAGASSILGGDHLGFRFDTANSGDFVKR